MDIMPTKLPEDVKNALDLAEPVLVPMMTVVLIVFLTNNIYTMLNVIYHVQTEPITVKSQKKPVKTVTKDVPSVKMKPIPDVLNVTTHGYFSVTTV